MALLSKLKKNINYLIYGNNQQFRNAILNPKTSQMGECFDELFSNVDSNNILSINKLYKSQVLNLHIKYRQSKYSEPLRLISFHKTLKRSLFMFLNYDDIDDNIDILMNLFLKSGNKYIKQNPMNSDFEIFIIELHSLISKFNESTNILSTSKIHKDLTFNLTVVNFRYDNYIISLNPDARKLTNTKIDSWYVDNYENRIKSIKQ